MADESRYFEIDPVIEEYPDIKYFFILGGRSCGKTYPVIKRAIMDSIDGNGMFCYVRRYKDSLAQSDMKDLTSVHGKWVEQYTDGEYNTVNYWQGRWYLERWSENENGEWVKDYKNPEPIGLTMSVNAAQTRKGADYGGARGGIANIIYDEALADGGLYLQNEWSKFTNVIATLIRDRYEKMCRIFMLANPVSKWKNPFFSNLGISTKMYKQPGTTLISYPPDDRGKTPLPVLFIYIAAKTDADGNVIAVDNDRTRLYENYFAFANSKSTSMSITQGIFELQDAAHLPEKYLNNSESVKTFYFKSSEEDFFQCDIFKNYDHNKYFLYFSECDEIKEDHYYFTIMPELERFAIIGLDTGHRLYKIFYEIYESNRVFYESNEVADAFHGWLHEAKQYVP